MENIFNKVIMIDYIFTVKNTSLKWDLYDYLLNNLENDNYYILKWDLENALTTSIDEKYI
jgi:hypothetical protein